jgi:tetratricopeptide (TPR) repeat protein
MVRAILEKLDTNVMDTRSIELRNYLEKPDAVRLRANVSNIPPSDVIEPAFSQRVKRHADRTPISPDPSEAKKLRRLGNELRLSGAVVRALEAFRRALVLAPADPWLLFDSARCLYSFSGARRDQRLERKAFALMRLAERRAGNDGELLSMIGESYSQMGEWDRAANVFRRVSESVGASFRSLRGQAEIALREGKIAHVIHNFAAANRASTTESLRRWTQNEVDYFTRLNNDEEYMELEVSRVNLIDSLGRFRSTALRLVIFGTVLVVSGLAFQEYLVANTGWTIAIAALLIWIAMHFGQQMLQDRIPFELVDIDEDE